VPALEKRIDALAALEDAGIKTWVSMAPVIPQLILTDLDALFSKLRKAKVSTVTVGMLRFTGYEESKIMFESRSGKSAEEVSVGSKEAHSRIIEVANRYGMDTTGASLEWQASDHANVDGFGSLDSFGDSLI